MKKQGTIQFRYGLSSSGKPISIENAEKGQQYTCLSCGAPLVPRQGKIRQHHFAHKSNPDNCSFETYLHKLTKYFIRTLFEEKQKLIAVREPNMHPCDRMQVCPFIQHGPFDTCYFKEDNTINLLDFESCLEEEPIKGIKDPEKEFIADLLFKSESKEPVLVEVFVKHPCTAEKIESGLRIIEIEIHSEQDVENLLSGELNKCSGIKFYGFEKNESPTDQVIGKEVWHGIEKNETYNEHTVNCKEAFYPDNEASWERFSLSQPELHHQYKANILQNIAKQELKERFEKETKFQIALYQDIKCSDINTCIFAEKNKCHNQVLKSFDLKEYYDTCQEVKRTNFYKTDLLFTSSTMPERKPTLIRIKTPDDYRLKNEWPNIRIIEIYISTETELYRLIKTPITETKITETINTQDIYDDETKVKFTGFNRKPNVQQPLELRNIQRFYLFPSGKAYVTTKEEFKSCRKVYYKDDDRSIFEVSIDNSHPDNFTPYDYGYFIAKQNGIIKKVCFLCKYCTIQFPLYYKPYPLCCLYKKYSTPKNPKPQDAEQCNYYQEEYMTMEKLHSTMPNYIIATL